jgi:HEAT repeat protein
MAYGFELLRRLQPAAFVFKAIVAAIIADLLLLAFILLRRTYRKRYFLKRDARVFEFRQRWDDLISGKIPYEAWRTKPFELRIVEDIALDAFEAAGPEESARLLQFLRTSGLIEKRVFEAKTHTGWRRRHALVALGRTRAPEGIPALADGLRDRNVEVRNAALRGLSRLGSPEAAEEILQWVAESGLNVPALPLQNALINCCRERPRILLPYLQHAEGPVREVLARVMGEVASPTLGSELFALADDELPELRAAAARAMSHTHSDSAIEVLAELARDKIWFVRLRAVVALGKCHDDKALPLLVQALRDSNRLVRMRAAEGLVDFREELVSVFAQAVATKDRYGLSAFLSALENAGLQQRLEAELERLPSLPGSETEQLLSILSTGRLPDTPIAVMVPELTSKAEATENAVRS